MDAQFWHRKWERDEIAFHEAEPKPLLLRHLPVLDLSPGARVFLPLCGKSRDIAWLLDHGYRVAGIELSPIAVEQFFAAIGLSPAASEVGGLRRLEAAGVTIFVGDVLTLGREALGPVDAVYDRAALVALPAAMRERYAAHLPAVSAGTPQLLVTFDYDPSRLDGPPFCVTETEVRRHYDRAYRVACIENRELDRGLKGFRPVREAVWHLAPGGPRD